MGRWINICLLRIIRQILSKLTTDIWLFRMLHWQNVEYVLQHGISCSKHPQADPNYVNIGHSKLIQDRHTYKIPIDGAGELGDYIPFYFAGHSPMLYKIKTGHGSVIQRPQEDIVFILCEFEAVRSAKLKYVFTDRHAKRGLAKYYNDPADFDKLQWEVIESKQWRNDEQNMARQDFKQAEFLINNHLPLECVHSLVVLTNERKQYFEKRIGYYNLPIEVFVDKNRRLYY